MVFSVEENKGNCRLCIDDLNTLRRFGCFMKMGISLGIVDKSVLESGMEFSH